MLRVLTLALIATTVAFAGTASAAHDDGSGTDDDAPQCASVTFVKTPSEEFYADVYVSKTGAPPVGNLEETLSYLDELTDEAAEAALDFITEDPPSASAGIVHVEVVIPQTTASDIPGYRIAFIVNTGACTP